MSTEIPEEQLTWIFYYGAHPLWLYLKSSLNIDITEVCERVTKTEPVLKTANGDLAAQIVKLPHAKKMNTIFNNDITFIVNSINTVFESLKSGVERDGEAILQQYKFALDEYSNMYLVDINNGGPLDDNAIAVFKLK